jgi:hypothetical protein
VPTAATWILARATSDIYDTVRYLGLVLLAALAGCGGAASSQPPPRPHRAPELVAFQRNGGFSATLDTVVVRADGTTRSDKRYGGAGRRYDDFRLRPSTFRRLRAALARLPARVPEAGAGRRYGDTYLLRYRGRTYAARQGAVPADLRPAVETLASIADGSGRGGRVHETVQAPA